MGQQPETAKGVIFGMRTHSLWLRGRHRSRGVSHQGRTNPADASIRLRV
jgi:hypothetical protein